MKKLAISAVAGAIAMVGIVPGPAFAAIATKVEIAGRSAATVKPKDAPKEMFHGPGVAKLKKNGNVLKSDPFTFDDNTYEDNGGLGFFKELYADKPGDCVLLVKFKGNDKYAASKDTKTVKCRKPE